VAASVRASDNRGSSKIRPLRHKLSLLYTPTQNHVGKKHVYNPTGEPADADNEEVAVALSFARACPPRTGRWKKRREAACLSVMTDQGGVPLPRRRPRGVPELALTAALAWLCTVGGGVLVWIALEYGRKRRSSAGRLALSPTTPPYAPKSARRIGWKGPKRTSGDWRAPWAQAAERGPRRARSRRRGWCPRRRRPRRHRRS
jgi:hypothetical protein